MKSLILLVSALLVSAPAVSAPVLGDHLTCSVSGYEPYPLGNDLQCNQASAIAGSGTEFYFYRDYGYEILNIFAVDVGTDYLTLGIAPDIGEAFNWIDKITISNSNHRFTAPYLTVVSAGIYGFNSGNFYANSDGDFVLNMPGLGISGSATVTFLFEPTPPVSSIPEPSSWFLLLTGFGIVGSLARRSRNAIPA